MIWRRGWRQTPSVWSRTATWWAFRTSMKGWHDAASGNKHWKNVFLKVIYIIILSPPAVVEDADQCRCVLGRPEWPSGGGRLGVERRYRLRRIFVVGVPDAKAVFKPPPPPTYFTCARLQDSVWWTFICPPSVSGCRASPITGATSRDRTAVRWSDTTTATGTTKTATLRGNISASTSTVSVRSELAGRRVIVRPYWKRFSAANPGPQCDLTGGWSQYGSDCYKLKADTRKSWSEARYDCVQEGGDLVSVLSPHEEQYITALLDPSYFDIWIGFSTLVRATPTGIKSLVECFCVICVVAGLVFVPQKCTKISCQVQAGNTQFTWSDAQSGSFSNWAANEPTV